MFEFLNTWQFNVVAYLFFIVIFFQSYKKAVKGTSHDGAATVLIQIIGGASIMLLAPFFPFTFPNDPKLYALLALACIFFAVSDRLQTTARKHLQVSTLSIVDQLVTIFLLIYGFTLFQEPVTSDKIFGVFIILFGNFLLFYKKGNLQFNKYIIMAVIATFALATAFTIDIGIAQEFNLPFYIMLTFIIPGIIIAAVQKIRLQIIFHEFTRATKKYYVLTGVSWGLAVFFSLRAFQFGEISTIVPLQATAVLLNVLVAYVFLKEQDQKYKKIIAAVLVIIGVYITTLS